MHPFIYLFGQSIPTYGICLVVAIIVGVLYAICRCKESSLVVEDIFIFAACTVGMGMCGAKLLYILVSYGVVGIIKEIQNGSYEFLTDGGLVFLGGVLLGIPGAFVGAALVKHNVKEFEKIVVPVLPLCHAIGRIGCFFAGCCYGIEYNGFLAIHYGNSIYGLSVSQGYFPTQILEALLNIVLFIILHLESKKKYYAYDLLFGYLFLYAFERFGIEMLRGDGIRGKWLVFTTSQWISIGFICACISRILLKKHLRKR